MPSCPRDSYGRMFSGDRWRLHRRYRPVTVKCAADGHSASKRAGGALTVPGTTEPTTMPCWRQHLTRPSWNCRSATCRLNHSRDRHQPHAAHHPSSGTRRDICLSRIGRQPLPPQMAGDPVPFGGLSQCRFLCAAQGQFADRTARMKMAAAGRMNRVWHVALQVDSLPLRGRVRDR